METPNKIIKYALANALWTALYIILIAIFLSNTSVIFGGDNQKTVLIPIAMLMLFVFSAAVTGSLIFGRPVLWYMENKKKEAMSLLVWTLAIFFVVMVIMFATLFLLK